MPGRLFGLDFGAARTPHVDSPTLPSVVKNKNNNHNYNNNHNNNAPNLSLEVRRPSMDHVKRPVLALAKKKDRSRSKDQRRADSKDKSSKEPKSPPQPKPVKMNLVMESPPVVLIDSPQQSSGALISGRLQVTPNIEHATLQSITMYLECTTTTKRPVQERCRNCLSQVQDLYEWNFFRRPKAFSAAEGMQDLPFSHLIPGHIPATTHASIATIDYSLHVRAKSVDGQEIEFRQELIIKRALRYGSDKNSVRVFPPTNLTLHVTLPNVIHPHGDFPVQCRMTGITTVRDDAQTRWRLRKLNWRIEELEKCVSPACSEHGQKVGGDGKGIQHESTREVGADELKQGWKTDLSDGQVEGEFMASMNPATKPNCGVEAGNGTKISHSLILEFVIAEEWAPNKKPHQATPTGAARVLRTQFALNVTERAGMGIAWDDEQPPMYEDVPDSPPHYQDNRARAQSTASRATTNVNDIPPASPPHYQTELTTVRDYTGSDLDEDVEGLTLNG
ncbi:related to arrestin (or S-antigen), N-terminal domain [Lecanosticta acicola]|uniref:Related to arrestin (Or S-antigen), N-terminal domain n=1 Tax=Lecanosticta acicola TaxID=111012 RepID=A0AAI8YTM0_9PEZI|nr:related to arrestin (or S-antigen), N-terminal domain [Lecanosticta acicola]